MADPGRETTYTLDEAAAELRRQECARYGHSWDVVEKMAGPFAIICTRCGRTHDVSPTPRETT